MTEDHMPVTDLIYDWNSVAPELRKPDRHIGFDDETLRDGLQSPSVCEPPIDKKIELLHLMDALGIVNRAGFAKVSLVAEAAGSK